MPSRPSKDLILGLCIGFAISLSSTSWFLHQRSLRYRQKDDPVESEPVRIGKNPVARGVRDLIGNTPLVRINSLSDKLGVEILGKAEFLNPGGSVKDRVALKMIDNAERQGLLIPNTGSCIFEGTSGSTGISLATIAQSRGYKSTIILPDNIAEEKIKALVSLGAEVEKVRPVSIVDKRQFVVSDCISQLKTKVDVSLPLKKNVAKQRALDYGNPPSDGLQYKDRKTMHKAQNLRSGFFADQFENLSNFEAHFEGTGPEIWDQTRGEIDAFVSGAGTGGTIAGVGTFLKSKNSTISIVLADPEGSGIHNKVKYGVMFDLKEREGTKRRHQVDTIVEGIGLNRITKNLEQGLPIIDDSFRVTDVEAIGMSRYLAQHDGLFLGSSSACNMVACIRFVRQNGWCQGQTIVTILCDSGARHYSKFWNDEYLRKANIPVNTDIIERLLDENGSK